MRILALGAVLLAACVSGSGARDGDSTVGPGGEGSGGSAASEGYLEGTVTIGPLRPVEIVDAPPLTPPPEAFASRSINVFREDGVTLFRSVAIGPDGKYRTALPPGRYVVAITRSGKFERVTAPTAVTVAPGATVRVDIEIDTGIR